jgi:hypothetical protein
VLGSIICSDIVGKLDSLPNGDEILIIGSLLYIGSLNGVGSIPNFGAFGNLDSLYLPEKSSFLARS